MSAADHGVALVLALVHDAARERRCASCGEPLDAASIEPGQIDPERIVAHLICPCGAAETIEIQPATEDGRAEIS